MSDNTGIAFTLASESETHCGRTDVPVPWISRRLVAFNLYGPRLASVHKVGDAVFTEWICMECGYRSKSTFYRAKGELELCCGYCDTAKRVSL